MGFLTELAKFGRTIRSKRKFYDGRGKSAPDDCKEFLETADVVGMVSHVQDTVECLGMEMKAVVPLSNLRRMASEGKTIHDLDYTLRVAEENMVNVFGLPFDNNASVWVSYMGNLYTVSTTICNETFTLHVWDSSGNTSVDDLEVSSLKELKEVTEWLENTLMEDVKGVVVCSKCKKKITTAEVESRYFAGRYCRDCSGKVRL